MAGGGHAVAPIAKGCAIVVCAASFTNLSGEASGLEAKERYFSSSSWISSTRLPNGSRNSKRAKPGIGTESVG